MSMKQNDAYNENMQEYLMEQKGSGVSECCGAGTYRDYQICENCGEHC